MEVKSFFSLFEHVGVKYKLFWMSQYYTNFSDSHKNAQYETIFNRSFDQWSAGSYDSNGITTYAFLGKWKDMYKTGFIEVAMQVLTSKSRFEEIFSRLKTISTRGEENHQ